MDLYRINLNLLIALDILMEEQNVTLASKKVHITQAAMSNNLNQLREIFNDKLLIREKNQMSLTPFARELQPKLRRVLRELGSLVMSSQQFKPETSKRIFKIGMSDYMAAIVLPALTSILESTAPDIKINVVSTSHLNSITSFERGEYDLAIGKVANIKSPVNKQLLYQDSAVCILNQKHPLASKKKITLKEYLSQKHVTLRAIHQQLSPVIDQTLSKLGVSRDTKISMPYMIPAFSLIEKSHHLIATILRSIALKHKDNYRYVIKPLPFKIPPIEYYLAWHQQFDDDAGHLWLREQLIDIGNKIKILEKKL